jgi:hypothetical protein
LTPRLGGFQRVNEKVDSGKDIIAGLADNLAALQKAALEEP